ncbi:hypothetical protein GCM10010371_13870 [Streptomyces subrutilus]|uniref:AAA+ ATPase domain-containing protein n=1 Tax=Streptomyces subrutilus TaxID=36818 RepID=A0A918V112_9ACTN|nr:hypothetical protein [Streptomyces subrutilus]GGZ55601.1 hypothetical protein GCM10010371_13870 [Streptomyces subrutilus]
MKGDGETQADPPLSLNERAATQINRADVGGTVNAVQNGNQYFLGPDGKLLFAQWERSLRRSSGTLTIGEGQDLAIDRAAALAHLTGTLDCGHPHQVILVRGEPGVGKTTLVLQSMAVLRGRSMRVLAAAVRTLAPYSGGLEELARAAAYQEIVRGEAAPPGVLVLDGAEAAQEGFGGLVGEAVAAAIAAGLVPVLISRDDAVDTLRELLDRAGYTNVGEIVVPPLDDDEIAEIIRSVPQLARLADDGRSRWLLRRIALVDLLLRSARRGTGLPSRLESEADVYAHIWRALVLNGGRAVDGVASEDRGQALLSLVDRRLTGHRGPSVPGAALASLRSDGILAPLDEASVISSEEYAFGHDVMRDFATARRLLLEDGLCLLEAKGPRWAVRAGRIYCQVRLRSGPDSPGAFSARWNRTYRQFVQIAEQYGTRWQEIPWEAVLSAGWCAEALASLTGCLIREPDLLEGLLRCCMLRFGDGRACDPLVVAPVVEWLARNVRVFSQHQDQPGDAVILAWLRGVAQRDAAVGGIGHQRRVRMLVREAMLRESPRYPSASFVEALALLGSDREGAAVDMLKDLARRRPHSLMPAVDRMEASRCLAVTDPALLMELAAAYYQITPDQQRGGGVRRSRWRMGQHEYLGGGSRREAQWWRGPFYALLQVDPQRGLNLIEAVVKDAVESRGARGRFGADREDGDAGGDTGESCLTGDILETGLRDYVGPVESWFWYRGALNGPQPCMSALMALNRWLELELIQPGIASVRETAALVLTRVGTLAGLGLSYGILLRDLKQVADDLDDYLSVPMVWELEHSRFLNDSMFRRGDELRGGEWLKHPPTQIAMHLVIEAVHREDDEAVARLRAVADRLRMAASSSCNGLEIRSWADHLDWECFTQVRHGNHVAVEVRPSEDIQEELDSNRARAGRTSKQYELLNRYGHRRALPHRVSDPVPADPHRLALDLRAARELHESLAGDGEWMTDGLYAVAAATVHMATGGTSPSAEDLRWSVDLLVAAIHESTDLSCGPGTTLPWSGDRLAALALPRALVPTIAASIPQLLDADRTTRLHTAVVQAAAHPVHEVREYVVEGLRPLWEVPCVTGNRACHHMVAWSAVQASVRLVLVGRGSQSGRRGAGSSSDVLATALDSLGGEEMSPDHLETAVPAVLEAARVQHCRTDQALSLRGPLLDAHARAACAWGSEPHTEKHAALAASLLRAADREPAVLSRVADRLAGSPSALSHLLRGLKTAATYERELVQPLAANWPYLMESVLTQPLPLRGSIDNEERARYNYEVLMGELVPNPVLSMMDQDMDGTLQEARSRWLPISPVAELVDIWTTDAGKGRFAVDSLIDFLKAQPVHEQVDPGLRWVRQLCVDSTGKVDTAGLSLTEWLQDLHPQLTAEVRPHFQAVVDGLALAQHPNAVALQRLDE